MLSKPGGVRERVEARSESCNLITGKDGGEGGRFDIKGRGNRGISGLVWCRLGLAVEGNRRNCAL